MKFAHRVRIDAPRDRVWALLMDLPAAAACVPGVRDIATDGDGLRGTLDVRIGPVKLALAGRVSVAERDDAAGTATLRADAADRRIGGAVRALVAVALSGDGPTDLDVVSDVAILGRLGELGQSLIARQADKVLAGFAENLKRAVAT
ncbi:MAG TPA: SRPBCC domain-containing protein [Candidatus Limnocylindria bacterium]|nr:SRPBCC domain-containing protein [Candidatus Limnocylindria bacterium]